MDSFIVTGRGYWIAVYEIRGINSFHDDFLTSPDSCPEQTADTEYILRVLDPHRYPACLHLHGCREPRTVHFRIPRDAHHVLLVAFAIPKDAVQIPIFLRLVLVVHHVRVPPLPKHRSHDRTAARGEHNFPPLSRPDRLSVLQGMQLFDYTMNSSR